MLILDWDLHMYPVALNSCGRDYHFSKALYPSHSLCKKDNILSHNVAAASYEAMY